MSWLRRVVRTIQGIIDEISDQSAYRRHLETHGVGHSAEQWRRFCDERWEAASRRAKCC